MAAPAVAKLLDQSHVLGSTRTVEIGDRLELIDSGRTQLRLRFENASQDMVSQFLWFDDIRLVVTFFE